MPPGPHNRASASAVDEAAGRLARWTVVISGASGLVGSHLQQSLSRAGHTVRPLVRRAPRHAGEIPWHPDRGELCADDLEGCDAVVNLSGESIAAGRWSAARKTRLRESRIRSTELLAGTIARLRRPPRVLVSASAVGYYGDRGDAVLDESSPAGRGFLPELCGAWEAACEPARSAGVRVVNLRIGLVLSRAGGALRAVRPLFGFGLGGVIGSGRQFMSWIALRDLLGAIQFALTSESLHGAVNATAPVPVTNRDFTRTLGRVLRRPAVLPAPGFAIRAVLGEMGRSLLLEGCRAVPRALLTAGFEFALPELEPALRWELGLASAR